MFISLYRPSVLSWIKLLGIPSPAQAVSLLPRMRIRYVNADIAHSINNCWLYPIVVRDVTGLV